MILKSKQGKHLKGFKNLTIDKEIIDLTYDKDIVEKVYFPLFAPNGKELDLKVKVGDVVKVGQELANRVDFYVPTFSSVSGIVKEIIPLYFPILNKKVDHLVIENDFKYDVRKLETIDIEKANKEEIIEAIKKAGIIGLGGAGFPTYIKYSTKDFIDTILINAVECEPYLTTDQATIYTNIDLLIKGINILKKAANANIAIIAIKRSNKKLIKVLEEKLIEQPFIYLKKVKDVYPMGWEKLLVQTTLKLHYKNLPCDVGVIVNNVQTAIAVADALVYGNTFSKRIVTFSGDALKNPNNVLIPIGVNVSSVIEKLGSYTSENISLLAGGPMTSSACMSQEFALGVTTGGVSIMKSLNLTTLPCLGCGKCIENCPANLQPIEIKLAFENRDIATLKKLQAHLCCDCGLCSFVCPSNIELSDFVKKAKLYLKVTKSKEETK